MCVSECVCVCVDTFCFTSVKSSSMPVVGSLTTDRPECRGDSEQCNNESTSLSLLVSLKDF